MQSRLANELARYAVLNEFLLPAQERRLLPFVELDALPYNLDGVPDQQALQLIRASIQYLHEYLPGEGLPSGHAELTNHRSAFIVFA
ncbi:MAG: hypothetical protein R3F50_14660 [Gammaproteobacteria bacterium]